MKSRRATLIIPILLIAAGAAWLLTTLEVEPRINWTWTLGLAVGGLLIFVISGFDKLSVLVGPFLFLACALSVMRQLGMLDEHHIEVPVLVIAAGVLLLIARSRAVPLPDWFVEEEDG